MNLGHRPEPFYSQTESCPHDGRFRQRSIHHPLGPEFGLLAIVVYAVAKRHNLLMPMITGRKILPASVPQPRMAGPARAVILLGCSALATAALANFL